MLAVLPTPIHVVSVAPHLYCVFAATFVNSAKAVAGCVKKFLVQLFRNPESDSRAKQLLEDLPTRCLALVTDNAADARKVAKELKVRSQRCLDHLLDLALKDVRVCSTFCWCNRVYRLVLLFGFASFFRADAH